ncbi:MAG: hypothetical protein CL610_13635 [Anaerolineaceae bacterium]|nr:hypothetical protein [Anaerolineaceae bacterium]
MDRLLHDPLGTFPMPPELAALPKADIHVHAEWLARLDRALARRERRPGHDWRAWVTRVMAEPPGASRLSHLSTTQLVTDEMDAIPENFVARVQDLLEEAAADGAILVEVRFGKDMDRPDFMALFREAERRVRARYPRFRAQAIAVLMLWQEPDALETLIQTCIDMAAAGMLYGVDFLYRPYIAEADWGTAYRVAARLAEAGLGVTAHVGEFSTANIVAAAQTPGIIRFGHATYAGYHPHLLDLLAAKQITVECSLSCNVVLGAAESYEAHPVRQFVAHGVPVALCTDDPVQVCTTIGREYAIAHALGFSEADLLGFTRNAINAAFIAPDQRAALLAELT